jgi:hypothetical protein
MFFDFSGRSFLMGRPTDHRGKKDEVKSEHRHQAKLDHNPSVEYGQISGALARA